jgi:thioredoxin-related protein
MIAKTLIFFAAFACLSGQSWYTNMEEAQELARKEHRHVLLNFSGSDWCGPCILLRKDVLDQPAFIQLADSELILVNADFPRKKKNQITREQQKSNDQLADRYNPQGQFPLTLLLTAEGKVLKKWEGNPGISPELFSKQIQGAIDTDK